MKIDKVQNNIFNEVLNVSNVSEEPTTSILIYGPWWYWNMTLSRVVAI